MRKPDDLPPTKAGEGTHRIRSAFLRIPGHRRAWPDDFVPALHHEEPAIHDLAVRLWERTRPLLEDSDEDLDRLSFQRIVDHAASDLFADEDIGIKVLAAAKALLTEAHDAIVHASTSVPVEATPAGAEPSLVARLDTNPPGVPGENPGEARLCLSIGDVVLKIDVQVPSQSWLYRSYERLRDSVQAGMARAQQPSRLRRIGRWGMMTDDRELTVGLRHQRRPEAGRLERETTVSLRSRRQAP
jgi:hypothetical protein